MVSIQNPGTAPSLPEFRQSPPETTDESENLNEVANFLLAIKTKSGHRTHRKSKLRNYQKRNRKFSELLPKKALSPDGLIGEPVKLVRTVNSSHINGSRAKK